MKAKRGICLEERIILNILTLEKGICLIIKYTILINNIHRSLSPASVSIIRILMDISFIWSSCSKHPTDRSQVLPSLVKGGLEDPRDLPTFFYQHLERDMRDLAGLIGNNFEEATFILHLVIKSLMQTAGEPCEYNLLTHSISV